MGTRKDPKQLAKLLAYALGRRPDEFGLVPDENGYVTVKELLQALAEEDGWAYVRRSHIQEVLLTLGDPPVSVADNRIRAVDRTRLQGRTSAVDLPGLLYTCVRRRAHRHVLEKGVRPSGDHGLVLADAQEMALRIGRRSDSHPVLLTVQVQPCLESGVVFLHLGGQLYGGSGLPVGCFTGPPLPKEKPEAREPAPRAEPSPGSFPMQPMPEAGAPAKNERRRREKEIAWKKGRRQMRKKPFDKW